MPRSQYNYNYPEVHPPQSQTSYAARAPTSQSQNERFSWIQTPSEALSLRNTQNLQNMNTSSNIPPLPVVPAHLQRDEQRHHNTIPEDSQPYQQQQQQQPQQSYPGHHQSQPEYQQQISKQQEAAIYQQARPRLQPVEDTNQTPQSQPEPHHNGSPQHADPVKETPDHPNYRSAIMPDENPLSPSSPTQRHHFPPARQTTHISVLPPTPSTYTFNTYAPAPQPTTSSGGGSWTHGLCSCSEPTICVTGLFCPCILYGRTQHRLSLRSAKKDPTNMLGYNTINGSCVAWALLCGVNGILSGLQKTRVRRSYAMDPGSGNVFGDCLAGCCCCCCVLAQNEKEVRFREEEGGMKGGAGGSREGYVPPNGMTFAPPPR